MLASKEQRTETPFCESERPLAKIWALLNQIFRGATKAGIPRRISQRTVWAQTGSDCMVQYQDSLSTRCIIAVMYFKCRTQSGTVVVLAQTV